MTDRKADRKTDPSSDRTDRKIRHFGPIAIAIAIPAQVCFCCYLLHFNNITSKYICISFVFNTVYSKLLCFLVFLQTGPRYPVQTQADLLPRIAQTGSFLLLFTRLHSKFAIIAREG